MTNGDIFSGIGGFSLAAKWAGIETIFHCENNKKQWGDLQNNFPKSIIYQDVTQTDFTIHNGKITILTGGFPCQDASIAKTTGKKQSGLDGERTGLWRHMVRAIFEIKPKYVVVENVANILKINDGQDFSIILNSLSEMGYNAEWRVCSASEIGAPHQRQRCYLVAYSNSIRLKEGYSFYSLLQNKERAKTMPWEFARKTIPIVRGGAWEIEPPVLCLDDGVSPGLVAQRLHGYGNAIVPQIAYEIYKQIQILENDNYGI